VGAIFAAVTRRLRDTCATVGGQPRATHAALMRQRRAVRATAMVGAGADRGGDPFIRVDQIKSYIGRVLDLWALLLPSPAFAGEATETWQLAA